MGIFYYLTLFGYMSSLSVLMTYTGIIWNKIETRFKKNPKVLVIIIYILNALLLHYGFKLPFIYIFLFCIFIICAVFFGTRF